MNELPPLTVELPPLTVELPLPTMALSPNSRDKWAKIRATTLYRYDAKTAGESARFNWFKQHGMSWPAMLVEPIHADITFVLTSKRRRDLDNLVSSLKAGIDGLRDAQVINDDSVWTLTLGVKAEYMPSSKRKQPFVRIVLTSAPVKA